MHIQTRIAFSALQARLAAFAVSGAVLRMDAEHQQIEQHEARIREMAAEIDQLEADNETIFANADEKGIDLSADDQKVVDQNLSDIEAKQGDIKRREAQLKLLRARVEPSARRSDPEDGDDAEDGDGVDQPDPAASRRSARRTDPRTVSSQRTRVEPAVREQREMMGFKAGAHFLEDVKAASQGYMTSELRNCQMQMQRRMDANVTFGEDGAFAVPPDVANDIKKKIDKSADLVGLCDRWTTSSDRHTWFLDEQEPWSNTNGISGQWLDEGETIGTSSPKLSKIQTDLFKYAIAVPASSEILRSSSQMEQLIRMAAPARIAEELNSVILAGNGIGKPNGIFNSGVLAVQPKETTGFGAGTDPQPADTVVRKNVIGAHNKIHPSCRNSPAFRWVANLDVEPQLEEIVDQNGNPLYIAGGSAGNPNLAEGPYDKLRGRPLIYSPHSPALGEVGDLAGIDFSKYLIVFGENMRADFSIHVRFLQDEGVFRFIIHVGGRPKWGKKVIEPNSVVQRSFAAAIAQRA